MKTFDQKGARSRLDTVTMDRILSGEYAASTEATAAPKEIKILNWNINRGLRLPEVMDFVSRERPDLCIFQEVDLNAKRTGRQDVAKVVASRFQFNYVFGTEFEELSQGSKIEPAFHGQAVFARSPIAEPRVLRFGSQSDIWYPRWYLPRWSAFQPRRGGRMALVAEVAVGSTKLVIYDVHLESQADEGLRLMQLMELVKDSFQYPMDTPVIVAGDLNTKTAPSPLQRYLLSRDFKDACRGDACGGTKPGGQTLDWIFTRGPVVCTGTKVHRDVNASDHYPVSTTLTVTV
jgi:endonuclease/exonuclease/phosphatase family metal-dependent hydrolase